MPETLKQKSVKGVLWLFGSRSCVQLVQFVISIVLALLKYGKLVAENTPSAWAAIFQGGRQHSS